ncbi:MULTISPECIES: MFS transporter [unclassified Francisella]|uniref:MFS transporter n=1 Tax=unclassified Francisella TaxID=2610885 RepID=UPI002E3383E3|nr:MULTISPECIES: MFS transporter [unclassified Francisella]MED7819393.1 MFS transporter [Francisella sp. 19S2-4]MED7830150.1 MFS transporter [Francisella sp. 19S2-10]
MIQQLTFKDKVKTVSIINLGAVLEWFEFCLYGYLTTYLSILFFPKEDRVVAMITIFGIFAASYIMRPLGGFILGSIGDRFGRRYAIRLSMILMCIPMLLMTLMPTYQSAGIWAILVLLFARMLQGFSVGGEYTGILVALAESASEKYRGLTTALAGLASQVGVILSATTVGVLSSILTKQQMLAYGWRIAFFMGLILAISSTIIQKKAKESPFFKEMKHTNKLSKTPLKDAINGPKMPLIWTFILTGYVGIAYYMMATFLPNILISNRGFNVNKIMFITVAVSCFYAALSPFFGWLSDIYGRKPLLYIPILLLAILGYPMFIFFNKGSLESILIAEIILAILISAMTASFQITVAELFPTNHRYSGMSAAYNTGNALFAGTTPMICVWLSGVFNSNYAPSFYLIISSIITLALIYKMPETRHSQEFEII